jgi:hypothetical protein
VAAPSADGKILRFAKVLRFCSVFRTDILNFLGNGYKIETSDRTVRGSDVRFSETAGGQEVRKPRPYSTGDKRKMDVLKMLAELRQEREQVEEAIVTLERLARGRGKRRGRPPAWMSALKRRGRPPGSKNKPKESAAA